MALGALPGMPILPFLLLGFGAAAAGWRMRRKEVALAAPVAEAGKPVGAKDNVESLLRVEPLALEVGLDRPRIGITVPGKVANSVNRNRINRWVREAWRSVAADLPPVDLVVIARAGAAGVGLEGARVALGAARDRLSRGGAR